MNEPIPFKFKVGDIVKTTNDHYYPNQYGRILAIGYRWATFSLSQCQGPLRGDCHIRSDRTPRQSFFRRRIPRNRAPIKTRYGLFRYMNKLVATNDSLIEVFIQDPDYQIKDTGEIWTRKNGAGHPTNVWRRMDRIGSNGYVKIRYRNTHLGVHRIVYQKYVGQLVENMVINHKDGNPRNNHLTNLELVTQGENNPHRYRVLGHPPVRGACKLTDDQVKELRRLQKQGWTNKQLREKFKIAKATVSYIVNNKTYSHAKKSA